MRNRAFVVSHGAVFSGVAFPSWENGTPLKRTSVRQKAPACLTTNLLALCDKMDKGKGGVCSSWE